MSRAPENGGGSLVTASAVFIYCRHLLALFRSCCTVYILPVLRNCNTVEINCQPV